ncbi:hypothetical protein [Streptomyces thermolilacinus]|uniref:Uncharacterized protein n=1 Tax=Streptomyces thermolilacinus SPC6 TaxID=1306406 RepID=A0A1D3DRD4_9ACTN|nr:hypothetical protein [Streptomyces thermolilacinus]OEJ94868.1 hypothetical protein J116_010615 [Streptomyces thermolilacinus SPC6]
MGNPPEKGKSKKDDKDILDEAVELFKNYTERFGVKKPEFTAVKSEVNAVVAAVNAFKPEANAAVATFNGFNAEATLVKAEWTKWDLAKIAEDKVLDLQGMSPEKLKLHAQAALDLAKELRPHVQRFMDQYPRERSREITDTARDHGRRLQTVERYIQSLRNRTANSVAPARRAEPVNVGNAQAVASHLNHLERRINNLVNAIG